MKKRNKPDVMSILAMFIAVGVLATGLVQGAMRDAQVPTTAMTAQK
jgi:hypothetical protein